MGKTITLTFDNEYVTAELWIEDNLIASYIPNEPIVLENLPIDNGELRLVPQQGVEVLSARIEDYTAGEWLQAWITASTTTTGDRIWFNLEGMYGYTYVYVSDFDDGGTYEIEIDTLGGGEGDVSLYNRVYLLNKEQALEFASSRLGYLFHENDKLVEVNRSEFIVNLIQVPFNVDPDYITGTNKITLADVQLDLEVDTLSSDLIGLDFGEIIVSELENNILDFVNTEYKLILPNIDLEVEIEPHEIVNKPISITAVIDAYSGDLTLNLYNGGDNPFKSEKARIGRIIPTIVSTARSNQDLGLGTSAGFFNSIEGAYIKVTKGKLEEGKEVNLVKDTSLISEISGYFEVTYYEGLIGDNVDDQQAIRNILEMGVVIKDA